MTTNMHIFETPDQLATSLAGRVSTALSGAIRDKGVATLLVSGGSTPVRFFAALSHADIDWSKVTVGLVDERDVPESSERSNAAMVRTQLLRSRAATATFKAMRGGESPKPPFDAVILGMGGDGHTASFFPGGDTLKAAIDPEGPKDVIRLEAPGAGEPRLTWTLPALLDTGLLALHIEGGAKRGVLQQALGAGPAEDLPIRAVLRQDVTPLEIYWCP